MKMMKVMMRKDYGKLFSDPTQILYVNVVLDKSNDEEANKWL